MAERVPPGDPASPDHLRAALRDLADSVDDELRARWDRSLPLGDALGDRWARAERLGFGAGASVYDSVAVFGDVEVGEHTWIGPWCLLDGSGGPLRIGAWCSISAGVHLYTHDTVARSLSLGVADRATGPVVIGDGCHLGAQSVIRHGVTIGRRCVIGANSFVNRDVPDATVVAGSPARPVGLVRGEGAESFVDTGPDALAELAERAERAEPDGSNGSNGSTS